MASKVTNVGAVASLYLSYFIYALGLVAAGQFGDHLATQWGTSKEVVIAAIAWMAIGKIITYTVAGTFADKFGRKPAVIIGLALCASFFAILPFSPSPAIGTVAALLFGAGNSFLDSGTYPTLMESNPGNAGTMNIIIKLFISAGQFFLPMVVIKLGDNWKYLLYFAAVYMVAMLVFVVLVKFPDYKEIAARQAKDIEASASSEGTRARFGFEGVLCLAFIFCVNGVVYLANQALPQIGSAIAKLSSNDGKTLTQFLALGSVIAVILTAILASKGIRSIRFVPIYAVGSVIAVSLLVMPFMANLWGMRIAAMAIGYFVSGGIMQLVLTAMSQFFPKAKGTIVAWYWMIGSLGGFILPYLVKAIVKTADINKKIITAVRNVDADTAAQLDKKFDDKVVAKLAESNSEIQTFVDQKTTILANGYTNVAYVAIGFAIVALLAAIVIYRRHVSMFEKADKASA